MGRTYHKDEWARRRTQALFRLLRTQAPADFRTRVLRRAQAMPLPTCTPRVPLAPPHSAWQRYRAWFRELFYTTPRRRGLALGLVSACVLVLGLRLAGWPSLERESFAPGQRPIVAIIQPDEQRAATGELLDHVAPAQGMLPDATRGPALATGLEPQALAPPTAARETRGVPVAAEQAGMPPLVPPTPWAIDERRGSVQPNTPRAESKRALAGKGKRSKKNPGPAKHAPA